MQPPPHSFTGLSLKPIPLPTYSDPCLHKEGPGTVTPMQPPPRAADGRTSLLRRDQELLLQCSPPRTALHRPTLIQYTRDWRTATILGHPRDRVPHVEWMHAPACLAHGVPVELSWLLVPGAPPQASGCGREVHVIRPRRQSPPPRRTGSDPGASPQGERGTRDKTSSAITSPAALCGNLCCVREVHVIKPRQPSPPPRRTAMILAPSPSLLHSSPVPRTLGRKPPRAATSAFRSPLPTYSGPRPNPG